MKKGHFDQKSPRKSPDGPFQWLLVYQTRRNCFAAPKPILAKFLKCIGLVILRSRSQFERNVSVKVFSLQAELINRGVLKGM